MSKKKKQNVSVPKGSCLGRTWWWCQGMAQKGFSPCSSQPHLLLVSRSVMSSSLRSHGPQHARLPCPSPCPGTCSNSCPLSQWCHPTISSSVVPFSSCLQPFPASGSFPMKRPLFKCNWLSLKMIQRQPQSTRGGVPCLPFQTAPRS